MNKKQRIKLKMAIALTIVSILFAAVVLFAIYYCEYGLFRNTLIGISGVFSGVFLIVSIALYIVLYEDFDNNS